MCRSMSDNPLGSIPSFNRVTFAAVLVAGDGDATEALLAAGIFDPVAVPVLAGDDGDASTNPPAGGLVPGITAVAEFAPDEDGRSG
jgi:hypothetical protein